MKRTFSFFAAFSIIGLNRASITTGSTTPLVIHRIIKDGPNVPKFNQIVSEYFHTVFGSGGDKYLTDFPTVDVSGITDREISGYISNEIDSVISHYGSGSIFSALKHAVNAHSPNKPRFRIHLFLGFLRLMQRGDLANKIPILKMCIKYAKEHREDKQMYNSHFPHVVGMTMRMNNLFGGVGVEISAKYLQLIDGLARSSGVSGRMSELFDPTYANAWDSDTNTPSRFLGVISAATRLCGNELEPSRKWTIEPIICHRKYGGDFLLHILNSVVALKGEETGVNARLLEADKPLWFVFNRDFILNRLSATPGNKTQWTLEALLKIFKSDFGNFSSIALDENGLVNKLFKEFVIYPIGVYQNNDLNSEQVVQLEASLGTQEKVDLICQEGKRREISLITHASNCQPEFVQNLFKIQFH